MRDLPPDAQAILAVLVLGVLWVAFGRGHSARDARGVVGRRNKRRFYSWWPIAVVAIALMWALDVLDDGVVFVRDDTPAVTTTEGEP